MNASKFKTLWHNVMAKSKFNRSIIFLLLVMSSPHWLRRMSLQRILR